MCWELTCIIQQSTSHFSNLLTQWALGHFPGWNMSRIWSDWIRFSHNILARKIIRLSLRIQHRICLEYMLENGRYSGKFSGWEYTWNISWENQRFSGISLSRETFSGPDFPKIFPLYSQPKTLPEYLPFSKIYSEHILCCILKDNLMIFLVRILWENII